MGLSHILMLILLPVILPYNVCAHSDHTKLLLISFDGFRHDYLDLARQAGAQTPNFDKLISNGVRAKSVINTFVTKTLPNHYSIVTGMYEENHGVMGNEMYDRVSQEHFVNSAVQKRDPKWWNNGTEHWPGEPIWLTNEIAAEAALFKRKSGVYFWPGHEAPLKDHYITYSKAFDASVQFTERVDAIVQWFANEDTPINLGLLYFEEPDETGHKFGPEAKEIIHKITELDRVLNYLIEELAKKHLFDHINIIITSDHGMAEERSVINLSNVIDEQFFKYFGYSPIFNILPNEGMTDDIYHNLTKVDHLHVYKKEDLPKEYHYAYNNRVMPIVVSAEEGYGLCISKVNNCTTLKGNHGFNNSLPSMHPFFIAHGPAFRKGFVSDTLNIVDIYALMCHILDIEPARHDGNLDRINHILAEKHNDLHTMITFLAVVVFAACVSGVCCVAACRAHRILRHRQRISHTGRVPLTRAFLNGGDKAGAEPLLSSSEEEIP